MTRKKASGVRRKQKPGKSKSSPAHPIVQAVVPSEVEELLHEVESSVNAFDYESAKARCHSILNKDPNNVKAMEYLASILMDEGDEDEARKLYLQCIQSSPNGNYETYFSLAQISEGKSALKYYSQGTEVIKQKLQRFENAANEESAIHMLKKALSDAFCSIAELHTSDLCDEEDAEESCKKAMEEAAAADPDNPDVYQCMANYHLIKSEDDEAVSMMKKSLSLWLPHHEALRDKAEIDPDSKMVVPEYDSRVKTSQLLIEIKMFEEAAKVLEGLLEENDKDFYVWYLSGYSNYLHGDEYKGNAYYYLEKAREVAKKLKGNEDIVQDIDQLLEELKDYAGDGERESDKENGQSLDADSSDDEECENNNEMDVEL